MLFVSLDGANEIIAAMDGLQTGLPRAIVRALNRGIGSARTVMVKNIAQDTGLKSKDVRDALTLTNATLSRPVASLSAGLKRIPLMDFKAVDTALNRGTGRRRGGSGVTYQLQGGRSQIPNAFIAKMGSGHTGVFARIGKARLPIRELFGPSLGHVFFKYRPEAIARAEEIFVSNFEHEMTTAYGGTPVPSSDGTSDAGTD